MTRRASRPFAPERRYHMPRLLPLIAAVLALIVYARPAEPAVGVTQKGAAFVLTRNPPCVPACPKPIVLEFTIKFDLPNTLNLRERWW